MIGGANAQAAGAIGSANAWTGSAGNAINQYNYMNALNGGQTNTPNNSAQLGTAGSNGTGLTPPANYQSSSIYGASDRRLKTDIVQIGMHKVGVPLYTWLYLWGEAGVGVMADELKKIMPEAVINNEHGFDMVNYSMIGGV
jgi:hypothetical protein